MLPFRKCVRIAMERDAFEAVKQYIREQGMLCAGDQVIVGVSGGADSVFLLYVLREFTQESGIGLSAVHVHHGIRGSEADEDAVFVRELCSRMEIPCHVEYADVPEVAANEKLTVEEAGRKVRYACFRREMERTGATKLAVGHHRDDSAETMLFNLVRGSGIKGLCGIAPVQNEVIRPLLNLRRKDIEEELQHRGIGWRTDATNEDVQYSRNRIRGELIPYLERELNREAVSHLNSAAEMLREIDAYMEMQADRWLETEQMNRLNLQRLAETESALKGYLIRRRISEIGGLKDVHREHIAAISSLTGASVGKQICLPGGRKVVRDYRELVFLAADDENRQGDGGFSVDWKEISGEVFQKIQFDQYTKCFDYDRIKGNLHLRTRKSGDRIAVFADGRTQSVKEYMINERIPAQLRGRIPLLMCGDEVLWIVGYRANEIYRVTEETRRFLLVTAQNEIRTKEGEE